MRRALRLEIADSASGIGSVVMATDANELADLIALWHGIELQPQHAVALARMLDELLKTVASSRSRCALTADLVDFDCLLADFADSSPLGPDRCSN